MNKNILLAVSLVLAAAVGLYAYQSQDDYVTSSNEPVPSISYLDILNNPEFKQRLAQAVRTDDMDALETLQAKAIEIGDAAALPAEEMTLISGERGRNYLMFQGKRELFNQAFIYRYQNVMDITPLQKQYPEAADLYDKALQTVKQRDETIVEIARILAPDDNYTPFLEMARDEWKKRNGAVSE